MVLVHRPLKELTLLEGELRKRLKNKINKIQFLLTYNLPKKLLNLLVLAIFKNFLESKVTYFWTPFYSTDCMITVQSTRWLTVDLVESWRSANNKTGNNGLSTIYFGL